MPGFLQKIKLPESFKTPRFRKRLKRTITALCIIGALFGGAGIFIGYFFEDTVKSIILSQLNKRLNCEIQVKDIEFSVFSKFPYATLHFIEATAYDARPDTLGYAALNKKYDPAKRYRGGINDSILLKAEDVYLQMSLWDLFFSKYRLKRVEVDNALLNLKVFADGTDNYQFLKPSTDTVETEDFQFDLEKLVLKDVACSYYNVPAHQDYKVLANDVKLKGEFSKEKYKMNIDGDVYVHQIISHGDNYFSSKNVVLDVDMEVDDGANTVSFSEGKLAIGNMDFDVGGYVAYGSDREELDLKISGNSMPLQAFMQELPGMWRSYLSEYKGSGTFNFNAQIKGSYSGKNIPLFAADLKLKDAEITKKESGITLKEVCLTASFTNGEMHRSSTSVLDIPSFSAKLNDRLFSGRIKVSDFTRPDIDLAAKGSFDLSDLHGFIQSDTISSMSGLVDLDFSFKGKLNEAGGFTVADFVNSTSSGTLKLSDGNFEFRNQEIGFKSLNGDFTFSNNDIISQNFKGYIGPMDFTLNGYFRNVFSYLLLEDERLQVVADFSSQHINMDELLKNQDSDSDTSSLRLNLSPQLDLALQINARKFTMGKFSATNVLGELKVRNGQILVKNFSFNAMDGRVSASGLIDATQNGKLVIGCDAKVFRVDIQKMFYQLSNFGQQRLIDENLKGLITADISFGSVWSNTFVADLSTVYATANITIENGELIKYAPIEGLSKQLKGRNFSNIKFATLTTQVVIKDKLITIPETKIVNDAIDFEIMGTHTFDNEIDYHVSVLFSDLLNKNKHENEFGPIEDDGLHKERYYFRITGTTEDPIYKKIDKQAYVKSLSTDVKEEGKNFLDIIKQEFGKKKDTANIKHKDPKGQNPNGEWQMEWEEEND